MFSWWRDTITRIRPGEKTVRGSIVPDWDNVNELVISNCHGQPASTGLSEDGRVLGIMQGMTLYTPATADIKAGDRIVFRGITYEINGEVNDWPSATGALDHLVINLRRYSG